MSEMLNWKFELYKKVGELTWSATPLDISEFVSDTHIVDAMGKAKDQFEFKFEDADNLFDGQDYLGPEDRIKIYQWVGTRSCDTSSDFLFDGVIDDF